MKSIFHEGKRSTLKKNAVCGCCLNLWKGCFFSDHIKGELLWKIARRVLSSDDAALVQSAEVVADWRRWLAALTGGQAGCRRWRHTTLSISRWNVALTVSSRPSCHGAPSLLEFFNYFIFAILSAARNMSDASAKLFALKGKLDNTTFLPRHIQFAASGTIIQDQCRLFEIPARHLRSPILPC